jgi:dihydrofolate reductase
MSDTGITLYIAASVDGYIATGDGSVDWLEAFGQDPEEPGGYEAFYETVDCLVMGSRTYEQVLGFGGWPYAGKPTYVLTSRDLPRADDAVQFAEGDVEALADRLTAQYDHVWLVGGADLAQTFLRHHLVDRLQLTLVPVLLGAGVRLFTDTGGQAALRHRETTTHESGLVELRYDIEG